MSEDETYELSLHVFGLISCKYFMPHNGIRGMLQNWLSCRATSEGNPQSLHHPLQVVSIFAAQTPEQQMKVFERAPKGVRKV